MPSDEAELREYAQQLADWEREDIALGRALNEDNYHSKAGKIYRMCSLAALAGGLVALGTHLFDYSVWLAFTILVPAALCCVAMSLLDRRHRKVCPIPLAERHLEKYLEIVAKYDEALERHLGGKQ